MKSCRIKSVLTAEQHAILQRFAALSGRSVSSVVADCIGSALPMMEQLSFLLEESKKGFSHESFDEALKYVKLKNEVFGRFCFLNSQERDDYAVKVQAYERFIEESLRSPKKLLEDYDAFSK